METIECYVNLHSPCLAFVVYFPRLAGPADNSKQLTVTAGCWFPHRGRDQVGQATSGEREKPD